MPRDSHARCMRSSAANLRSLLMPFTNSQSVNLHDTQQQLWIDRRATSIAIAVLFFSRSRNYASVCMAAVIILSCVVSPGSVAVSFPLFSTRMRSQHRRSSGSSELTKSTPLPRAASSSTIR